MNGIVIGLGMTIVVIAMGLSIFQYVTHRLYKQKMREFRVRIYLTENREELYLLWTELWEYFVMNSFTDSHEKEYSEVLNLIKEKILTIKNKNNESKSRRLHNRQEL